MKLVIEMQLDGDAFQNGNLALEVENILQRVVYSLEEESYGGSLLDTNGNDTGHWEVIDNETI